MDIFNTALKQVFVNGFAKTEGTDATSSMIYFINGIQSRGNILVDATERVRRTNR